MNKIYYGRQDIDQEDIQAVVDVLKSDFITQGPIIEQFEKAMCEYTGATYAVAVSSATAALHLACQAMGLTKGDDLWTSPNTFVASANCALYCGASVGFVDINKDTYNMDESLLEEKLNLAQKNHQLPKIVVPVHFAGLSCNMKKIKELSKKFGFRILEDASHAVGSKHQGLPVGSCAFSDAAVFSFHPVKLMTTGEGGMVLTNDKNLHQSLLRLRTHGITRNPHLMSENHGPWYYQQTDLGFNYRLTDIQAALGLSQLKKLKTFITKRHALVGHYLKDLKDLPLTLPQSQINIESTGYSAFHLFCVRLDLEKIKKTKEHIFAELQEYGIIPNVHYIPVHTQPYYKKLGFKNGIFPQAEKYYEEAMTIPLYANMSESDQGRVIDALKAVLK